MITTIILYFYNLIIMITTEITKSEQFIKINKLLLRLKPDDARRHEHDGRHWRF